MKTYFSILLLCIIQVTSYSQDGVSENLTGIGIFKIDKSTTHIIDVVKKEISNNNISEVTNEFNQVIFGVNTNGHCPNLEIWKISKYFIGDIELRNLELFFYNDVLFQIKCNYNQDLEKGLTYKYGKGIAKDEHRDQFNRLIEVNYHDPSRKVEIVSSYHEVIWKNKTVYARSLKKTNKSTEYDPLLHHLSNQEFFLMRMKSFDYDQLKECEEHHEEIHLKKQNDKKYNSL